MPRQTRQEALQNALARLHQLRPAIKLSVIANIDGLLVAAYPLRTSNDGSQEALAAMTAVILALAEQSLGRMQQGEPQRVILEGVDGVALVQQCTVDSSITVLADRNEKMGVLSQAVRRTALEIRDILNIRDF